MFDWMYFPKESLASHLRRRKPIGRKYVGADELGRLLIGLTQSELGSDILLTLSTQQLRWLTDGRVECTSWVGVELSNAGAYLAPKDQQVVRLHRGDRQFDELLSADGAGLCATFFLIQSLQNREFPWQKDRKRVWKSLNSFLDQHPESRAIRNVLD